MRTTFITRTVSILFLLILCSFAVSVRAQSNMQGDNLLIFGEPIAADLAGSEQDFWTFNGTAGQIIAVSAERFPPDPDSQLDLAVDVYDPAGTLIASDDNSAPGTDAMIWALQLPVDGVYTVVVRNITTWIGGNYQVTAVENAFAGCFSPQGTMFEAEMQSVIVGHAVRYRVYMPPCHESTGVRYPYVILMHGSNSDDRHWDRLGIDEAIGRGVVLNRLPPMAVVLPFGGELANTNTFRQGASWEYVVIDELMPLVESAYCLQNTAAGRAIGGISRGGFWAFEIAFLNPDVFGALGGHSPFFDLYHAPPDHNPLDLTQVPGIQPPFRIWMDRGKDDYAQLNIDRQHNNMQQNNIPHIFNLYATGRHEDAYWQSHLDDYLNFYGENWSMDVSGYPLCEPGAQ